MKKLIALSLAAVVAVTSIGATITIASAHGRDNWHERMHRDYDQSRGRPFGYVGPFFIEPNTDYQSDPHLAWCLAHYKTYNPATNRFFIKRGVSAVCVSPYPY